MLHGTRRAKTSLSRSYSPMQRFLPLLFILLAAVAVRWESLNESLWLDELHSAWVISGDWTDVAQRARIGNQSPLYFYVLKCCRGIGGSYEPCIRLPSLLSVLATTIMLYLIALRATGSTAIGALVATVAAFDPKFIFYATEARPYAVVQMVALMTVACFYCCVQTPTMPRRVAWITGSVLLCYLHYTAVLVPLTTALVLVWLWRSRGAVVQYSLTAYTIDISLVVISTVPLWSHMLQIAGRRQQWEQFIPRPTGWTWFAKLDLDFLLLVPLLTFLAIRFVAEKKKQSSDDESVKRTGAATAATWSPHHVMFGVVTWLFALTPIVIVWTVSAGGWAVVLLYRYVIFVPPIALLTWCSMAHRLTSWRQSLFIAVVLGYCVYGMGYATRWQQDRTFIRARGEDWRAVAAVVRRDKAPILLRSGFVEAEQLMQVPPIDEWDRAGAGPHGSERRSKAGADLVEYCLGPLHAIYDFGEPSRIQWPLPNNLTEYDVKPVSDLLVDAREAWIILRISRKRYKESLAWAEALITARGGGTVVAEKYGSLWLLRLEFK
jgi:hypothetical protein